MTDSSVSILPSYLVIRESDSNYKVSCSSAFSFPSSPREQVVLRNLALFLSEGLEQHRRHGGAYEKPSNEFKKLGC